ncbi:taurine ABC transporter, ATP-binding protein [Pseudooceanicola batsensis HTCC2597]|uniref:Taurine ABC transporter, ATP-binding protein n=1 Tax=Pseudooceanicola batsensis (strain ATCC BAA-863 / DSM 15984 / KCTC 12145 / HTCC2597) TaxID=252305 RepID=A3TZT6_PSEBH|nr:ABC transporter ATP-binding protein [Pseudooceanicola batsensis]EAQ02567.1 taurine ABC transporter, ATP-binding protein [Pseudooceanicola batsensis HTCC2597]
MTTSKISFRNATKVFGAPDSGVTALKNLNLDIRDGEIVTVVGPSGCGKSTAMNMVAGLLDVTSGEVLVDGKPVLGPGPDRGVIFQQYALFPWLTVRQNVEFGLKLQGMDRAKRKERALHYLGLVGLASFSEAYPKTLSGGMKQRCAIARAYAVNPSVLLMDEPFGALDALTRVKLQDQLLDTWSKDKRTVMFITHDVDEAVYIAHRVIVLAARPGRLQEIVEVDLPFPRNDDVRLSPEFTEIRNRVWRAVYHRDAQAA